LAPNTCVCFQFLLWILYFNVFMCVCKKKNVFVYVCVEGESKNYNIDIRFFLTHAQ
jgi:hypothetical protein